MKLSSPLLLGLMRAPALFATIAIIVIAARLHHADLLRLLPFAIVFLVAQPGGPLAKQVVAESSELEIEYPFLVVKRLRYADIAGVEVRPTFVGLLRRVRIFPREGFVIEMDASQTSAEAFVAHLALRARIAGVKTMGELRRPALQRAFDVLPIVIGVVIAIALRRPVSAAGLGLAIAAALGWTLLGWHRVTLLAQRASSAKTVDDAPSEVRAWLRGISHKTASR